MGCKRQKATHVHLKPFINSSVGYLFIHPKVTKLESQGDSWLPSLLDLKWKWCRWGSLSPSLGSAFFPQDGCIVFLLLQPFPRQQRIPTGSPGPQSLTSLYLSLVLTTKHLNPNDEKKKQYNSFIFQVLYASDEKEKKRKMELLILRANLMSTKTTFFVNETKINLFLSQSR